MLASTIRPTRIEILENKTEMTINWLGGTTSELNSNDLRRHCACSFCRASGNLGAPNNAIDTHITSAKAMGSTGIQLIFSDGHDKGIYPWGYLKAIADGCGVEYFNELE